MQFFRKKDPWPQVLEKAASSVVMLVTNTVRSWEGSPPMTNVATGFVVDKKLGLILTLRTVVKTGPITAQAVFLSNEEIDISPIYRDPEHNFGFFQYDPKKLEYMSAQELPLYPQGAKVGLEVRVVGSDAGEKLMVLSGTISDMQRMPPGTDEAEGMFQDVNIFYMTSSSGTSEGSGGAPVLDSAGRVVALNASSFGDGASSYFLPLDRVVRALEKLKKGEPIPRGTIQTIWIFTAMDEVKRLGLPANEEEQLRKANRQIMGTDVQGTGALVVGRATIGGTGYFAGLSTGDILIHVNNQTIVNFLQLEEIFDECIENLKEVKLEVRRGPSLLNFIISPQNMNETMPGEFIEYSGGVFHPMGFHLAFMSEVPVGALYVAHPGYSFLLVGISANCVITEIANQPILNLKNFEDIICSHHDGEKVSVRYFELGRKHVDHHAVFTIDRKWFKMYHGKREEKTGSWNLTLCSEPSEASTNNFRLKRTASVAQRQASFTHLGSEVFRSLVVIDFSTPFRIDGVESTHFTGTGLIVDTQRGLVVADRSTVVSMLGDVKMIVASTFEVECKVIYLHPMLDFVVLQYDPTMLGTTDVKALDLFPTVEGENDLRRGDNLNFYGFTPQRHNHAVSGLKVTGVERCCFETPQTPAFRPKNFDRVELDNAVKNVIGGIFLDEQGRVRCILDQNLSMISLCAPIKRALTQIQSALDAHTPFPQVHSLGLELGLIPLSQARQAFNLPDEWIRSLSRAADEDVSGAGYGARDVLQVENTLAGTWASRILKNGDLVLAAEGQPVVSYSALDIEAQKAGIQETSVNLTICRDRNILQVSVPTIALTVTGTKRIINFSGIQLQETHTHVGFHGYVPSFIAQGHPGVYISSISRGSPAERFGVDPVRWISEVNSVPVHNLNEFLTSVESLKSGEFVRFSTISLGGQFSVATLEVDLHHWRTTNLQCDENGNWILTQL